MTKLNAKISTKWRTLARLGSAALAAGLLAACAQLPPATPTPTPPR